ncbi:MAG: CheR family methyltransferase, partial [Phycisphaerae bacterium]
LVLVQHLDPTHPSLMPELLARHTKMPVQIAAHGQRVVPNHLYIMPPNVKLTIQGGVLQASTPVEQRTVRTHIDTFLRSLAEDQAEHAIGVVLSGAGSDGTMGLKAIKEHGGITMVQSPASAKYDSMPRSALATGLVDYTLPIEEIPAKLVEHVEFLENLQRKKSSAVLYQEIGAQLPRICEILHRVTGHDFSGYKPSTMIRRIERRLQVWHLDSVVSYVTKLEQDSQEAGQLFKDLLIGVTQFFRDPEAFEALTRHAIPELLENRGSDARVRVWVPGCATGEEAYSIAILLSEHMTKLNIAPQVQIFATDIDEEAIDAARAGKYPASIVEQMAPDRRERFFSRHGDLYQVNKPVRDLCVFSLHNLVRDPPFSALDLISCRNLLIYLDGTLQKKLIPLFHYALCPRGYLFLGSSEGLADYTGLFREVDKKHRLFQSLEVAVRPPVVFALADSILSKGHPSITAARPGRFKAQDVGRVIERLVLDFAPPCVVINERAEIIYAVGETGLYLQQPTGVATLNIIDQARKGLSLSLRTAIREANNTRGTVVHPNLAVRTPGGLRVIDLIVRPVEELSGDGVRLLAVIFQAVGTTQEPGSGLPTHSTESAVQQLESELKTTRGELQTTVEELE